MSGIGISLRDKDIINHSCDLVSTAIAAGNAEVSGERNNEMSRYP